VDRKGAQVVHSLVARLSRRGAVGSRPGIEVEAAGSLEGRHIEGDSLVVAHNPGSVDTGRDMVAAAAQDTLADQARTVPEDRLVGSPAVGLAASRWARCRMAQGSRLDPLHIRAEKSADSRLVEADTRILAAGNPVAHSVALRSQGSHSLAAVVHKLVAPQVHRRRVGHRIVYWLEVLVGDGFPKSGRP